MDNNFDPMDKGIQIINYGAEKKKFEGSRETIEKLYILCNQPKGNAFSQLQQFRKLTPIMINYILFLQKIIDGYTETYDRMVEKMSANNRKKWNQKKMNFLLKLLREVNSLFQRWPWLLEEHLVRYPQECRIWSE